MNQLPGFLTVRCFWAACKHVEVGMSPTGVHDAMEAHYDAVHTSDLDALGFPTKPTTSKEHDMSNVIRCDGPTCDQTTAPDSGTRMSWLSANRGAAHFDFHSPACLAEWADQQPAPRPSPGELCLCTPTADHTPDQHDAATTVVDGR